MIGCGSDIEDERPLLKLQLQGQGEDATRMEKRLRCAGRALDVRVEVDWDAARHGSPVVRIGNQIVADHLMDTTELEMLLQPFAKQAAGER